jgi:RNA polymerase sigma factor (sigma-70 family)
MNWKLEVERFTKEEEADLARDKEGGDMVARERLIMSCLPYAVSLAARMVRHIQHPPKRDQRRDEAVSDAMLGLVKAVDALEPHRGRLTTLVSVCVRQEVWKHWRLYCGVIYVPNCAVDMKQNPSQEMMDKAANASRRVSLHKVTRPNMTDGGDNDPAIITETKEEAGRAMTAFLRLSDREREVVDRVVMHGETLRDVGEMQGVSRERIRQVKQQALERLREEFAGEAYMKTKSKNGKPEAAKGE